MFSGFLRSVVRAKTVLLASAALAAISVSAFADNLVTNGDFETTTDGYGQIGDTTNVTGWTTNGYNFVFSGSNVTTGVYGASGYLSLWNPGNGSNNGFVTSPAGGNFLALDGAFQVGAVSQTINGLTVGALETLTFYYAGSQQYGFDGPTTEGLTVSLGSDSDQLATLSNVSHGFTGWNEETVTFTATNTSEVLSFLANGTPNGEPPMTLLDGVSLTQTAATPEPGSIALLGTGLLTVGGIIRRRLKA